MVRWLLCLLLLLPGTATARPSDDGVLQMFGSLALTRGEGESGWVRKWTGPVRVLVEGEVAAPALERLDRLLHQVSALTGLAFARDEPARGRKIQIRFRPHDVVRQRLRDGSVCMSWTFGNSGALHTGLLLVSDDYVDCLAHEFMHLLGFDAHWRGAAPSVLAHRRARNRASDLSVWDCAMIRLLYHPSLTTGLDRQPAMSVARAILETGSLSLDLSPSAPPARADAPPRDPRSAPGRRPPTAHAHARRGFHVAPEPICAHTPRPDRTSAPEGSG